MNLPIYLMNIAVLLVTIATLAKGVSQPKFRVVALCVLALQVALLVFVLTISL